MFRSEKNIHQIENDRAKKHWIKEMSLSFTQNLLKIDKWMRVKKCIGKYVEFLTNPCHFLARIKNKIDAL